MKIYTLFQAIALSSMAAAFGAVAHPVLTMNCHNQIGSFLEYGIPIYKRLDKPLPEPKIYGPHNRNAGSNFTAYIDSSSPKKLLVTWGNTKSVENIFRSLKPSERSKLVGIGPKVEEYVIIASSANLSTAFLDTSEWQMSFISFLPRMNRAFLVSITAYAKPGDVIQESSTFECEFTSMPSE